LFAQFLSSDRCACHNERCRIACQVRRLFCERWAGLASLVSVASPAHGALIFGERLPALEFAAFAMDVEFHSLMIT
jgi:hypothetical protein